MNHTLCTFGFVMGFAPIDSLNSGMNHGSASLDRLGRTKDRLRFVPELGTGG